MGQAIPLPEHRAHGHRLWDPSAPVGIVLLGRTSTGTMQDPVESLSRQFRKAYERKPAGFVITGHYWDVESGGIDLDRRSQDELWRKFEAAGIPRDGGMAELRAVIASGDIPFSIIMCEDINRAGRDMLESLRFEKEARAAGILILATDEPIDVQAPQGSTILMRRMRMAESEYFRYNLKTLMWDGLKQYAIGGHNTGKAPYGYAEERTVHPNPMKAKMGATRARLIPHPDQAQWVTKIFEWRVYEKLSVPGIARRLTGLGIPNPSGGKAWSSATVDHILRNPKYTGRIVLGRTTNVGATRRKGEMKIRHLPREHWTWADEEHAHQALTDLGTWEKAQTTGAARGNTPDTSRASRGQRGARLYPYRARIHCRQCNRRMHGITRKDRRGPEGHYTYYLCPTLPSNPADNAKWPGHVNTTVREDIFTAALSQFLDDNVFCTERRARLAELIPATQARQDQMDDQRAETLNRQLAQAAAAMDGIAAEMGQLAGKNDPASTAIRERLTTQFNQRYDEQERLKAELDAITEAEPLPGNDLTLLDELPNAIGLLAAAPDDIKEQLLAALDMHAVYRKEQNQATIVLTLTDTTPGTITRLAADPRVDSDTGGAADPQDNNPATSANTFADVPPTAIAHPVV